ncbi:hypothetical protein [Pseudomonas fluorescens]|uniref:Uncharacterized protein n=1 Tax=Pseudomonas fluorescens TaxID=294 RepID=A0A5E7K367_PSEFL|nr:hypothetical protein [Pseudomonas fluorescens]VVO94622.1 hypothetical protein PS880_02488 [Pseudomonas fluorescens]
MSKPMTNWNETPLLHAGTKAINTPVKTALVEPCQGQFMRFNVGNIHAIKEIRNAPQNG